MVIGGGITGLAAAHRLSELASSLNVVVLEASDRPGGWVRTEEIDGYVVERGPDAMLREKPGVMELVRRLGLGHEVVSPPPRGRGAYVVFDGRLQPIPAGFQVVAPSRILPMLRSPLLSWPAKIRAAAEVFLPRGTPPEDESVGSFVRRRYGSAVLDRLAQPLAGGIYGVDVERLSLRSTMPRFQDMEQSERSVSLALRRRERAGLRHSHRGSNSAGARYGLFVSFARGMQTLPDALAKRLGERLRLKAPVRSIEPWSGRWRVALEAGEILEADAVIVALPTPRAAGLVQDFDRELADRLGDIDYGSVATVTFAWPETQYAIPWMPSVLWCPRSRGRRCSQVRGRVPSGRVGRRPAECCFGCSSVERTANARWSRPTLPWWMSRFEE